TWVWRMAMSRSASGGSSKLIDNDAKTTLTVAFRVDWPTPTKSFVSIGFTNEWHDGNRRSRSADHTYRFTFGCSLRSPTTPASASANSCFSVCVSERMSEWSLAIAMPGGSRTSSDSMPLDLTLLSHG